MAIITAQANYIDFVTVAKSTGPLLSVYYFINTTDPGFPGCFLLAIDVQGRYQTKFSLGFSAPGQPTTSQVLTDFPNAKATTSNLAIQ